VKNQKLFYGWWVVVGSSIVTLWAGGIFYGITAFVKPIVEEFKWSFLAVSLAGSIRNLEIGIFAPVFGFLADRFGPRKVIFFSGFAGGLGFILLSRTSSLGMFYVAFIILSIGLSGMGMSVTTTAVANWFKKNVSKAMGLTVAGYGAGGILLPIIVWLIAQFQWRLTFFILGLATWVVILPSSLILRHKPEMYGYFPDGKLLNTLEHEELTDDKKHSFETELTVKQALKTKAFWLLTIVFTIQFMILNAVTFHVMPYLVSQRFTEKFAALIATLVPLASIVGRLFFGWLGDVFDKKYVLATSFFLQAVGLFFFWRGNVVWEFLVFLICFGLGFGGVQVLRGASVREYFGRRAFGSIHGMVIAHMTFGGMIGPPLVGWIFDARTSYSLAWLVLLATNLIAVPVVLGVKKHQ
jgi:MFS family permease